MATTTKVEVCADIIAKLNVLIYKASDDDIIKFMKGYSINPDIVIEILDESPDGKIFRTDTQCQLIYICCLVDSHDKLLAFLLDKGVNLNPQCDLPELLYICRKKYIPVLHKFGSRLNPDNVPHACEQYLLNGNIDALMDLRKHGVISTTQLKSVVSQVDLPFRILDKLFERIFKLNATVPNALEFQDKYNQLITFYIGTFSLFIRNGYDVGSMCIGRTYSFVQNVVNTYFDKLIEYVLENCSDGDLDAVTLMHYSNIDIKIRHQMKYVYTDEKYETLKKIFRTYKVPTKIIKKKKTLKIKK